MKHEAEAPVHDTWTARRAQAWRDSDPDFSRWAAGVGPIVHRVDTQARVHDMAALLVATRRAPDARTVYRLLEAADRVALAAMWLTVHLTYARNVWVDGRPLVPEDFKDVPEGHTGGSLNMVPAYVGYLLANALSGHTRGWIMGQGHAVAGVDASNVVMGNLHPVHASRYDWSDVGLSRMARDFYSYAIDAEGRPASPLGSHVNAWTAGGISEGGYLGFAELQYVHTPLPGERLVAFLSDGAFEEQRGSDWAPRWWRAEDTGFVSPIMILNGRRIEQRSTLQQQGGVPWLEQHLRHNGFDPIGIDGTDPAAFAWAILTMEERQAACAEAVRTGEISYPVPLHYAIAEAPKGWGFHGAGTNAAHNLPLGAVPRSDAAAREHFNASARALWIAPVELAAAASALHTHAAQDRPLERDHAMACRDVKAPTLPRPAWDRVDASRRSPMAAIDRHFAEIVSANPDLRVRVGNPDELRSNQMNATLDLLKHRVLSPESGISEALGGSVITALNEEAVVSAALANKAGLNVVVTYEAFGMKMAGALRQEILFARHLADAGRPPRWLSLSVLATSHTWENGKNEQSHQDPGFAETLLAEMSDVSRVVFPVDANSAVAALRAACASHGQYWTMVVPKRPMPLRLTAAQAEALVADGCAWIDRPKDACAMLVAIGAYQLGEALRAASRLRERGLPVAVACLFEPARFRVARDAREAGHVLDEARFRAFVDGAPDVRVFAVHTRPEPMIGLLRRLDTGPERSVCLGYVGRGGTLDVSGMLYANRCTWAHIVRAVADRVGAGWTAFLDGEEQVVVTGRGDPRAVASQW